MKKLGGLILCVMFLAGCSGTSKEIERGMALRSELLKGNGSSFDTKITADYGDKMHTFQMSCTAKENGDLSFTVTQPESISGITGTISDDGGNLTFDDTALFFDLLTDEQLSPISAPWIFLKTLRSGYLTAAGMEEDFLRLTIDDSYADDALTLDIWLNKEDVPVKADILYDGSRILSVEVENFRIL